MDWVGVIPLVAGIVAILVAAYLTYFVSSKSAGNKRMKELMNSIHRGAMTFLNEEYKIISIFVVIVMAALLLMSFYTDMPWQTAISFLVGAIFSALAGNIGMRIATKSNARAAEGVKKSFGNGLRIAFSSGAVMGLSVVGLGIIGVYIFYQAFIDHASLSSILFGFGFGASSIALFARVGGGIYTKSADVGADIVGKVEAGIPEDDPRNPAVIADNVGDNVGDVAGMGADLFESYVDSIIASITLAILVGYAATASETVYPLLIAGIGIFSSIIALTFVRSEKNAYTAM
ncbi:MAG: sodium-translocating pyrophosphatase, partial [Thermoplasmata archaeon]